MTLEDVHVQMCVCVYWETAMNEFVNKEMFLFLSLYRHACVGKLSPPAWSIVHVVLTIHHS